ncbi:hypothetical protein GF336_00795 [Candidatus Woesearchaeota archaeon]|nr:hypothetical protein [Candidatus Woesearchaeota archaeon]
MIHKCYEKSKEVIRICSTKHGLFASGGKEGYDAVWARDSVISMLGASLEKEFKQVFKASLDTVAKHQSSSGQIPNAVDKFSKRKPHVDYASIDSTLLYIIGIHLYSKRYKDKKLLKKHKKNIQLALQWLRCQDFGEKGLLVQQPTSDWQDAFPHKYGYTINTQALYYKVLNLTNNKKDAKNLKNTTYCSKDDCLWNKDFYLPFRWKNHGKYKEQGDWFDTLGNLFAIIFDLAEKKQAKKILSYIEKNNIHKPYPIKAIYPPIKKDSKHWQDYYNDCDAKNPYHYLNAGIWPFIGGFYILALIKQKQFRKAHQQLERLAESNLKNNFPEWINPLTREAFGKLQAWDAGVYMLAYRSLKKKKVLL